MNWRKNLSLDYKNIKYDKQINNVFITFISKLKYYIVIDYRLYSNNSFKIIIITLYKIKVFLMLSNYSALSKLKLVTLMQF